MDKADVMGRVHGALMALVKQAGNQSKLARLSGLSQNAISQMVTRAEAGEIQRLPVEFISMFEATGLSMDEYLLGQAPAADSQSRILQAVLRIEQMLTNGLSVVAAKPQMFTPEEAEALVDPEIKTGGTKNVRGSVPELTRKRR